MNRDNNPVVGRLQMKLIVARERLVVTDGVRRRLFVLPVGAGRRWSISRVMIDCRGCAGATRRAHGQSAARYVALVG
jgi:hypothetical protein